MNILVFLISGILMGSLLSHLSAYFINSSEDCEKPVIHKVISIRNFIISILNGLLWMTVFISAGINKYTILYVLASSILLCLSVVDFGVFELPHRLNIVLAVIGLVCLFMDITHWYDHLIGAVIVSGVFFIIGYASQGKNMGFGDVVLMAAAGLMLGWQKIVFAMVIGAIVGSVIHSIRMVIQKKTHVLAFGPYLAIGIFVMMCYGDRLIQWYKDTFLLFE